MTKTMVLVLSGYGLNCEEETKYAFELASAKADIIHINDIVALPKLLHQYQILVIPGGFSYGDDTGSGNAFANKIRNHLWSPFEKFIARDTLMIGICNGFQILVNLGVLPALNKKYGEREVALLHNDSARYTARWVDIEVEGKTPWFADMKRVSLPVAHGEGRFYAPPDILATMKKKKLIAARYIKGDICNYQNLSANPNGALENIAAITDETGRILGMMPHPERAIDFTHLPHWPYLKEEYMRKGQPLPTSGPGLQIFKNAVSYFT